MDTDRLLRIFGRMMETHGTIFVGSLAAIIALLLLVFVMRKIRARKSRPAPQKMAAPTIGAEDDMTADEETVLDFTDDADIDLSMMDEVMDDMDIDIADDAGIIADIKNPSAATGDELNIELTQNFNTGADELEDLDDITIPQIGEAPPPKQSRFFATSWLGKKHKDDAPTISLDMTPTGSGPASLSGAAHKSAAECARLGDIERKLMALRELYEAGLIAPEIYVVKAREFAAQV